ncbi:ImuA family protein [Stieleria sp. JC731]|uniref:ImuA family protein n=1 Tax=Pirellulaceae TaxID=2691357 RepID=UPI001E3BBCDB|nr:hypothetical protein [Stieleria sp. JC731]
MAVEQDLIEQQLFSFMDAPPVHAVALKGQNRLRSNGTSLTAIENGVRKRSLAAGPPTAEARRNRSDIAGTGTKAEFAPEPNADQPDSDSPSAGSGTAKPTREQVIDALRSKVGCVSTARVSHAGVFSTGCRQVDQWLPGQGLHPASLTEWVAAHDSAAAESVAMVAAAQRLAEIQSRPLVIVDCEGTFYPPAAVALGVPANRVILLRPGVGNDAIWAIDQALRSRAVAAVFARLPMRLDDRDGRRLQLAAEEGQTPGLFIRNFQARHAPSFAETQFYVAERKRPAIANDRQGAKRLSETHDQEVISITLDRVRGGVSGKHIEVRFDDTAILRPVPSSDPQRHETAAKRLASQLANPAIAQRVAAKRKSRVAS